MKDNGSRPINQQYLEEEGKFIQMLLNSHTLGSFNFDKNLRAFIQDSQGEDYMSEIDSYLHENRYSVHDFESSSESENQAGPENHKDPELKPESSNQHDSLLQKSAKQNQNVATQKEETKKKLIRKINQKKRKENEKKRKIQRIRQVRRARQERQKLLEVQKLFAANKREQQQWAHWGENLRKTVKQIESEKDFFIPKNPFDLASDYEVEVKVEKKRLSKDYYSDYDDDPYQFGRSLDQSSEIYQLLKDKSDERKSIEDKFHSSAEKLFFSPGMLKIQIDRINNMEQYEISSQVEIVVERRDKKKEKLERVGTKKKVKLE